MNTLTPVKLVPLLLGLAERLGPKVRDFALNFIEQGLGGTVTGLVEGREETEDVETELDDRCEEIVWAECQAEEPNGLRVRIISEHHPEGYGCDDPNVICQLDPFDGTDQARRLQPIWEAWYSVLSFTTPDGKPLVGMCVDIIAGILYIADAVDKKVTRTYLKTGKTSVVYPSKATELSGESAVASYKGKWRYLEPWFLMVSDYFRQEQFRGVTHYSWGGSFVYALIAAGVLDLYLMIREPTDEIRPGRAFVAAADLCVYSVTEGGILRLFQWGQRRRVTFFIAAPTRELAQSVVDGIWKKGEEDREGKGTLAKMRGFFSRMLSQPRLRRLFLVHA